MMVPIDFGDNTASGPELATNGVKGRTTLFGGKDEKVLQLDGMASEENANSSGVVAVRPCLSKNARLGFRTRARGWVYKVPSR
jgi:hypothetical protein